MTTHFITTEIDLNETEVEGATADLHAKITNQLQTQGEPLRWAVTQVEAGKAQVEAVVLSGVDAGS